MDILEFYSSQGIFTDPGKNAPMFEGIPKNVPEICDLLQGLCIEWYDRFKYPIPNERNLETNFRYMDEILDAFNFIDKYGNITEERAEDMRLMSTISHYANLALAMARHNGIPARKRVGFAVLGDAEVNYDYTVENPIITYEIIEYWDEASKEWKQADPCGMGLEFIPAAKAFADCRSGKCDPDKFINVYKNGVKVIIENLLLDLAAVCKLELLTWDRYGWMLRPIEEYSDRAWEVLDKVAAQLNENDKDLDKICAIYESEEGIEVPKCIFIDTPVTPPHKAELKLS